MPWINTIPIEDAESELTAVYDDIVNRRGKLSNIMRIQSLNPVVMASHIELYMGIMFGKSELKRWEREMIGTVVSTANDCAYCTSHHAQALMHYWKDSNRLQLLIAGSLDEANLERKAISMIEYAIKLTKSPGSMAPEDVNVLKNQGLSDSAILDLNLIISYFNFVNRIAVGLGVEFDENEISGYEY